MLFCRITENICEADCNCTTSHNIRWVQDRKGQFLSLVTRLISPSIVCTHSCPSPPLELSAKTSLVWYLPDSFYTLIVPSELGIYRPNGWLLFHQEDAEPEPNKAVLLPHHSTCFINARTDTLTNLAVRGAQMHSSTYPDFIKYTWKLAEKYVTFTREIELSAVEIMINLRLCVLIMILRTIVTINFSRFCAATF